MLIYGNRSRNRRPIFIRYHCFGLNDRPLPGVANRQINYAHPKVQPRSKVECLSMYNASDLNVSRISYLTTASSEGCTGESL